MTRARSRYSSSGIATRREVRSAWRAWEVVNGCVEARPGRGPPPCRRPARARPGRRPAAAVRRARPRRAPWRRGRARAAARRRARRTGRRRGRRAPPGPRSRPAAAAGRWPPAARAPACGQPAGGDAAVRACAGDDGRGLAAAQGPPSCRRARPGAAGTVRRRRGADVGATSGGHQVAGGQVQGGAGGLDGHAGRERVPGAERGDHRGQLGAQPGPVRGVGEPVPRDRLRQAGDARRGERGRAQQLCLRSRSAAAGTSGQPASSRTAAAPAPRRASGGGDGSSTVAP